MEWENTLAGGGVRRGGVENVDGKDEEAEPESSSMRIAGIEQSIRFANAGRAVRTLEN